MGRHHGKYDRKTRALFALVGQKESRSDEQYGLNQMIQVEEDFFRKFEKRIYITGSLLESIDLELRQRLEALWHAYCFDPDSAAALYHEDYQGTFGEGGQPDPADLELIHIQIGARTRKTNLVRINLISAVTADDAAVLIYEYTWDFMDSGGTRVSETGQLHETWVKSTGDWVLLTDSGGPYGPA